MLKYGSTNYSIPNTEPSLAKVNHYQLLPVATKNSLLGVGEILDAGLINSVQKSWNMLRHCPLH